MPSFGLKCQCLEFLVQMRFQCQRRAYQTDGIDVTLNAFISASKTFQNICLEDQLMRSVSTGVNSLSSRPENAFCGRRAQVTFFLEPQVGSSSLHTPGLTYGLISVVHIRIHHIKSRASIIKHS